MKLKLVIVDLEISPRVKKWALRAGIPAAAVILGGVAYAGSPVPSFTSGEALTAANMNALVNAINALQTSVAAVQAQTYPPSGFSANILAGLPYFPTNNTAIIFDNDNFDLAGEYSTSTGTFTPANTGTYLLTCTLYWRGQNLGGTEPGNAWYNVTHVQVNGADVITNGQPTTLNDDVSVEATVLVGLNAGDAVTCVGNQEDTATGSGAAQLNGGATNNVFSGVRVN